MILGFTGPRIGLTNAQRSELPAAYKALSATTLLVGGAPGSDEEMITWAISNRDALATVQIEIYPASEDRYRYWKRYLHQGLIEILHQVDAPLTRNWIIVARCDHLLAASQTDKEKQRSGTWATIRYARKAGKPHTIIWPDGEIQLAEGRKSATMLF
jgi:predicted Rossmann fold nucleotide-binding protein DprA/Smf involved in DNA uptake